MHSFKNKLIVLLIAALIAGCANVNLFKSNRAKDAALSNPNVPTTWQAALPHDGNISNLANWWQQFNDPLLVQLIESAQNVSSDIASAKARIVEAQTSVVQDDAASKPNITLDGSATRSQQGLLFPPSTNIGAAVNASWELDVWGKAAAAKSAAEAQLTGKKALWHDARIIVAAETARQYVNYRLCENLAAVASSNAESASETARLSDLTSKAGFLAPASAIQANAQAADAANLLKKQQLQCVLMVKAMVALTAMPEPELQAALNQTSGMMPKPAGIEVDTVPAKTLAQRPDVLNAERNVSAASFEIESVKKERYPTLSLAGNIGWGYDTSINGFSTGQKRKATDGITWSIGPVAISMPIFDAGVRKANVNQAKAQYVAAKSIYESVARNAVREVEEALATLNSSAQRLDDVSIAAKGFQASFDATDTRFKANLANLFELEEARRANLQAQNNVFLLENDRVQAWVLLYRALGGGWNSKTNEASATNLDTEPKLVMDKLLQFLDSSPPLESTTLTNNSELPNTPEFPDDSLP
ncbi:MAG: efflux transporter outer membrane subunit [Bdellovibrio sp.]|nr:efflux transporter outer membrane subunit [Methylotenera sp.]